MKRSQRKKPHKNKKINSKATSKLSKLLPTGFSSLVLRKELLHNPLVSGDQLLKSNAILENYSSSFDFFICKRTPG